MMAPEAQDENAIVRLTELPLVKSTYSMLSVVYANTKDNHPYLKLVCDVAEKSVKTITTEAISHVSPILQTLEPQINVANKEVCKYLNIVEEKLPILHQTSDEVFLDASQLVVGAKDTVIGSITGVVGTTKGVVNDGVEMTKAVVNGSINTVLGSRVVRRMSSTVDLALTQSENILDRYLPETNEEMEEKKTEGFEVATDKPNYPDRVLFLLSKIRRRSYQKVLAQAQGAKGMSQEAIEQLGKTAYLVALARQNVNNIYQMLKGVEEKAYDKFQEWKKDTERVGDSEAKDAEQIESQIITVARVMTQRLQATCLSLLVTVKDSPNNMVTKAHSVYDMSMDLHQKFRSSGIFKELDSIINISKRQLRDMKYSIDDMMDWIVNNTPLNWLVPDFTSALQSRGAEDADSSEEEMEEFCK
uniref:Perilipin n=1 Tax=Leptobrachium leishanense TaxID=445787 RepID=A0A8C5P761_9ANUR